MLHSQVSMCVSKSDVLKSEKDVSVQGGLQRRTQDGVRGNVAGVDIEYAMVNQFTSREYNIVEATTTWFSQFRIHHLLFF